MTPDTVRAFGFPLTMCCKNQKELHYAFVHEGVVPIMSQHEGRRKTLTVNMLHVDHVDFVIVDHADKYSKKMLDEIIAHYEDHARVLLVYPPSPV